VKQGNGHKRSGIFKLVGQDPLIF